MSNIVKRFGPVTALNGVSLQVRCGTVHALMGENGAGKSTLMKILLGIHQPDDGEIIYKGKPVRISDSAAALSMGISMIHQELSPILDMTVADNIFLKREPLNGIGFVKRQKLIQMTEKLFSDLQITGISARSKMKDLSIAQCQMVEIAKAVSFQSDLIIMDEPTSAISEKEVQTLFQIIRRLRDENIAIIYISHKMDEIFEISDEITVLCDGRFVGTDLTANLNRDKLIKMMVGRELRDLFCKECSTPGDQTLQVESLTLPGKFKNISFAARAGEILGIAGLMGAGRTEIVETIFGMHKGYQGRIKVGDRHVRIRNERDAINSGIALVTEDRRKYGLVLGLPIKHNIALANLKHYSYRTSWLKKQKESSEICEVAQRLRIKCADVNSRANTLSGGNQQKVVLAKWFVRDPAIYIFDEPTRGIDVGAKAEIYRLMSDLAKRGKTILMISSEMPEIIGMSDRIIVIREGLMRGELTRADISQEKIMELAAY